MIALLHETAVFAGGDSLVFGKEVAEGVYIAKLFKNSEKCVRIDPNKAMLSHSRRIGNRMT